MTRDLSVFTEDNLKWRSQRHRVPWRDRVELIRHEFPETMDVDWNVLLRDEDILGRFLKDVLKVDQMEPGRAGPRPNLDYERGMRTWQQMTGRVAPPEVRFTEKPFAEAFAALAGGQSLTTIARKTSISRSRVHRLLTGQEHPTIGDLRGIAAAYSKDAGYFAEYRTGFVIAAIAERLAQEAEMATLLYTELTKP